MIKKTITRTPRWALIALASLLASCAGIQQDSRYNRAQRAKAPDAQDVATAKAGAPDEMGSYLAKSDEIAFELSAVNPAHADASVSEITDQSFSQALRATYSSAEPGPWMAVLKTDEVKGMKAGDQVVVNFHARSVEPYNPTRDATVGFYVYQEDPWKQVVSNRTIVDDVWREYTIIFSPDSDFADNALSLAFDFGLKEQAVEIANIRMTDINAKPAATAEDGEAATVADSAPVELPSTSATYEGRSKKAPWRVEAEQRIKQHRMHTLKLNVLDEKGAPAKGAKIAYVLKQHAFGFGTAVNKRLIAHRDSPDHQMYANKVKTLFNKAVLENGMKWNQWESEIAPFLKEDTLATVAWLEKQGLAIRGNVLVWPGWDKQNPADLRTLEKAQLAKRIDDHIKDIAGTLAGRVAEWDVVNESRTNRDFMKVLGDDAIADWFKAARKYAPGAKLYHNDFGILNGSDSSIKQLEDTIALIRKNGGPIDGLGLQSHFDTYLPSPERLIEVLDRLAKLGLDIQATEFDVNVDDEQTQADFTRDFLTVMFSHPNVSSVTFWGFWEGQHWKPSCALFRKDWSAKPNGQVYLDLVNRQWTSKGNGQADATGNWGTTAFLGDYDVKVTYKGKTTTHPITLSKSSGVQSIRLGQAAPVKKPTPVKPAVSKPAVSKPATPKPVVRPATPRPQTPKNVAPPKTVPAVPKAVPAVPKAVPAVPKAVPAVPKAVPATPKPAPAIPAIPKATPAAPKVIPTIPNAPPAAPGVPNAIPAVPKKIPTIPKVTPAVPKAAPAVPKAAPAVPKAAPAVPTPPKVTPPKTLPQLPSPTLPKPSVKTPAVAPKAEVKRPQVVLPKKPAPRLPTPSVKPVQPKVVPAPPAAPQVTPAVPKAVPVAPKAVPATPAPSATPAAGTAAQDRMEKLRERLRAAKARLAEKSAETPAVPSTTPAAPKPTTPADQPAPR